MDSCRFGRACWDTSSSLRHRFQIVPETKTIKNRLHIDIHAGGGRAGSIEVRRQRVGAEAARFVKLGATRIRTLGVEGVDHYGVAMRDREGNEFDIN